MRHVRLGGRNGYSQYAGVTRPTDHGPALDGRPEPADLGRIGRRALRGVLRWARADLTPTLAGRLVEHLGGETEGAEIVGDSWALYEHVNVQTGLDAWLTETGREHEIVGVADYEHREFGLAGLMGADAWRDRWAPRPGNVSTVNVPCGPDGQVKACVACALYLVREGEHRVALLLRGLSEEGRVTLQAASTDPGEAAKVLARIREQAQEHNVFRGQVLSFGGEVFDHGGSLLQFHRRPDQSRSSLVLPPDVLDAIERQVVEIGQHRETLLASGQHLKRGLLLYGPPGTGKTHTVRYLLSTTPDVTVVQLTGAALRMISEACSVARALTPSLVVVEDVDLIAEDRGMYPGEHPLLFQLLNEMDGLAEDADIAFVLTTNRADLLEPALAARPGRVDQAVELRLPDLAARRALLELYRGALRVPTDRLERVAAATDGVTASFLKEVLRRAAVMAAGRGRLPDGAAVGSQPLAVDEADLDAALDELQGTRSAMTRVLLGSHAAGEGGDGVARASR
jgi:hypothetical protein